MGRVILALGLFVAFCCGLAARADVLRLRNGQSVEGKVERIEADKLVIQTKDGPKEFTREQVKSFSVQRPGPNGKLETVELQFKPKPVVMPFVEETEHYVIKTDVSEKAAKNAGKAMEQLYKVFTEIFRPENDKVDSKTEVVIFAKEEDFRRLAGLDATGAPKGQLGFFRAMPDGQTQIATYRREGDEFGTMNTLYHEATHQFLLLVMGGPKKAPPLWLNEGLAVYFENSRWENGVFKTGIIPNERLAVLQKALRAGLCVHLADLMKRGKDTYDALCYSESWSLIYFFIKSDGGAHAKRFAEYFKMLREGKDPDEAFKTCFTADLDKLERAWKKFVLEIKLPPKK